MLLFKYYSHSFSCSTESRSFHSLPVCTGMHISGKILQLPTVMFSGRVLLWDLPKYVAC